MTSPQYSTGADADHGETPSPVRATSYGASMVPGNPVEPAAVVGSAPAAGNPVTGAVTTALALPPPNQPGPRTVPAGPGPAPVVPVAARGGGPAPVGPAPVVPVTTRGSIPPADGNRRAFGATAIPPAAQ